eukprot:jgi/Ulvmu1/7521/UM037_0065.1
MLFSEDQSRCDGSSIEQDGGSMENGGSSMEPDEGPEGYSLIEALPPNDPWSYMNDDVGSYMYPSNAKSPKYAGQKPHVRDLVPITPSSEELARFAKIGTVDFPVKV